MIVPGRAKTGNKWVNRESVLKVRFLEDGPVMILF